MVFIELFFGVLSSCVSWFVSVFEASGLLEVFFGLTLISLVHSRIISPLLRSAGSDRARRSSGKDDANE